jgi:hypothetical protein
LVAFATAAVIAATGGLITVRQPGVSADARWVLAELALVPALAERPESTDYDRGSFGEPWTDNSDAAGSGNGCDTRNDILDRDLRDKIYAAIDSCPRAVASGELRSPYSGQWVVFRRGKGSGAKVQIDHIVPLAYAWAMGARRWNSVVLQRFANDPANLVAVDGDANQDKGDKQPSRWMPANSGFHCRYAIQFVTVVRAYGLYLDRLSYPVLREALSRC